MIRLTLLTVLFTVFASAQSNNDQLWHHWKRLHGKQYNAAHDEQRRRSIWEVNVARIQEHNLKHDLGLASYTMGLNKFSDMNWKEFSQIYLPYTTNNMLATDDGLEILPLPTDPVPSKMDWRNKGSVTNVKDQVRFYFL